MQNEPPISEQLPDAFELQPDLCEPDFLLLTIAERKLARRIYTLNPTSQNAKLRKRQPRMREAWNTDIVVARPQNDSKTYQHRQDYYKYWQDLGRIGTGLEGYTAHDRTINIF